MSVQINDLNNFKRHNEDIVSTDKKAIIMAVNWGLNPRAGIYIMSYKHSNSN